MWALISAILLVSVACDPGHGVTFINQTGVELEVYSGGLSAGRLAPHTERTLSYTRYSGVKLFEARDLSGTVLFSRSYSWNELEERDWKILILPDEIFVPSR